MIKKPETMDERAKQLVESLRPFQEKGERFPCPRCGRNTVHEQILLNPLSRYVNVYICQECGMDEALRDITCSPLPLTEWSMVQGFMEDTSL